MLTNHATQGRAPREILEKIVEDAKKAAELDDRWTALSAALSDPAKKSNVVRDECKVALAK